MGTLATCYEPAEPMLATRTRQPETKPRSCGRQSAYESLFNRRLQLLPPTVGVSYCSSNIGSAGEVDARLRS